MSWKIELFKNTDFSLYAGLLCSFRTLKLRPSAIDFQAGIHFWVQPHILKSSQLVHSTKFLAYIFFSMICYMQIYVTVWKIYQYFHFIATLAKKVIFYCTH